MKWAHQARQIANVRVACRVHIADFASASSRSGGVGPHAGCPSALPDGLGLPKLLLAHTQTFGGTRRVRPFARVAISLRHRVAGSRAIRIQREAGRLNELMAQLLSLTCLESGVGLSGARDQASGGYGSGLAIAKRAIQLHRGEITTDNHAQGNFTVSIGLPARPHRDDRAQGHSDNRAHNMPAMHHDCALTNNLRTQDPQGVN